MQYVREFWTLTEENISRINATEIESKIIRYRIKNNYLQRKTTNKTGRKSYPKMTISIIEARPQNTGKQTNKQNIRSKNNREM